MTKNEPAPTTRRCVECDRDLSEADLVERRELCARCAGLADEPEPDEPEDAFAREPETPPVLPPLPAAAAKAAKALALEREHILGHAERGDTVTIVTVGGKKVRMTTEKDGRVVFQGPEGFLWVQSAVPGAGYVARDVESGRVMRGRDGSPIRIASPAQILHPRDRGIGA